MGGYLDFLIYWWFYLLFYCCPVVIYFNMLSDLLSVFLIRCVGCKAETEKVRESGTVCHLIIVNLHYIDLI